MELCEEIGVADYWDFLKLFDSEEMLVTRHDKIRFDRDRTFKDAINRHILEYRDCAHRPDNRCRPARHRQPRLSLRRPNLDHESVIHG